MPSRARSRGSRSRVDEQVIKITSILPIYIDFNSHCLSIRFYNLQAEGITLLLPVYVSVYSHTLIKLNAWFTVAYVTYGALQIECSVNYVVCVASV